jgi:hypothetical protein
MSSGSGEGMCPLCDGLMLTKWDTVYHDFVNGICLECGYCYWTEPGLASLATLNEERETQELEPLKELKTDLEGLDDLRLERGLERLEDMLKTVPEMIERIRREVKK